MMILRHDNNALVALGNRSITNNFTSIRVLDTSIIVVYSVIKMIMMLLTCTSSEAEVEG